MSLPSVTCRVCGWTVDFVYATFAHWTHDGARWRCDRCPRPPRSLFTAGGSR